jgi:hypothetical protein
VQCGAIHIRIDGNRGNSHLVTSADDAHSNLAAVRDENLLEHMKKSAAQIALIPRPDWIFYWRREQSG